VPILRESAPERYRGTGVRIEDEVLVTETGHEVRRSPRTVGEGGLVGWLVDEDGRLMRVGFSWQVLTASVPKEISHLTTLMSMGDGAREPRAVVGGR
jgi:Xaa-Pro aminopeptidase